MCFQAYADSDGPDQPVHLGTRENIGYYRIYELRTKA